MKIEYILIKHKNDFCQTTRGFINLLSSNERLNSLEYFSSSKNAESGSFQFNKKSFKYDTLLIKPDFNDSEVCFKFTVEVENNSKNSAEILDQFDEFLIRVNNEFGNIFHINYVWDELALYYTKDLYQYIAKVENKLRAIINLIMFKSNGLKWLKENTPKEVKTSVEKRLDNETENYLQNADFIKLGNFLFDSYPLQPDGTQVIKAFQKLKETNNEDLEETIDKYIKLFEYKSNWERFFSDLIQVDNLKQKWDELYEYRNIVAHSKKMRKKEYDRALSICKELINVFDSTIDKINCIVFDNDEADGIQVFTDNTMNGLSQLGESWIKLIELAGTLSKPVSDINPNWEKITHLFYSLKDIPFDKI